MDMSDIFIGQVAQLGAMGATQEINLRLLADKVPQLKHLANAYRLEDLEKEFFEVFGDYLTEEEKISFSAGRVIRNKILHGDFKAASVKAAAIEAKLMKPTSAIKVDLATGQAGRVQDMSTEQAGIFGWLLATTDNGLKQAAETIFKRNIGVLVRISNDFDTGKAKEKSKPSS